MLPWPSPVLVLAHGYGLLPFCRGFGRRDFPFHQARAMPQRNKPRVIPCCHSAKRMPHNSLYGM